MIRQPPRSPLFPYPPLFRSLLGTHRLVTLTGVGGAGKTRLAVEVAAAFPASCFADLSGLDDPAEVADAIATALDRKSTRLNSSHSQISYAVFCLKKKKTNER